MGARTCTAFSAVQRVYSRTQGLETFRAVTPGIGDEQEVRVWALAGAASVDFDGWLHLMDKELRFRVQNEPDCGARRAAIFQMVEAAGIERPTGPGVHYRERSLILLRNQPVFIDGS